MIFLEKYEDYYIHHYIKEEIFKMNKKQDESLEDVVERFMYSFQREKLHNLVFDTLKFLLLRAIKDE